MVDPIAPVPSLGRRLWLFVRTTVLGGILVLVPIAACLFVLHAAATTLQKAIEPMEKYLPVKEVGGLDAAIILSLLAVFAASFALGLLVQTAVGRVVSGHFSRWLGKILPGYSAFRALSRQVVKVGDEKLGAPLIVKLGSVRQFGLLIEEHPWGEATVFFPSAPAFVAGSVQLVPLAAIERLNVTIPQLAGCIQMYGVGSDKLLPPRTA